MQYPMIAQRVFNTPLLVDPSKGHAFLTGLGARLVDGALSLPAIESDAARLERASRVQPRLSILGGELIEGYRARGRRMFSMRDGIAIVEMTGTLVHRGDWVGESSGTTSYEGLAQQIEAAATDPAVRGIALEVDSFGGEVAGVFDLADAIRAARAKKPVWAFVAESALSAAYALASQADRIVLPRTGEAGSIGILIVHADYSQRLSDEGVAVNMIHAGAHKVDGNPYEALPEAVRDQWQAEAETLRSMFAETVGAGRGARFDATAALATQARVFRGARAVEAGLADAVSDLRAAFAAFAEHVHRRQPAALTSTATGETNQKELAMTGTTKPTAAVADAQPTATITEDDAEAVSVTTDTTAPEADAPEQEPAPAAAAAPAPARHAAGNLSRQEAAAIAEVGAQAERLGVKVNVAEAIREGVSADALRARVLEQASARGDATAIVPAAPARGAKSAESPLVAAAKRAAAQASNRPAH
ncbi:MAG: serine peptidase [Rhodobacteraceae bacterium HLUCCA12]|nr:MAG: serine peptidase [Rhodobacteraceae bacterium HLUCCA12]